jgi:hypothetical protein
MPNEVQSDRLLKLVDCAARIVSDRFVDELHSPLDLISRYGRHRYLLLRHVQPPKGNPDPLA